MGHPQPEQLPIQLLKYTSSATWGAVPASETLSPSSPTVLPEAHPASDPAATAPAVAARKLRRVSSGETRFVFLIIFSSTLLGPKSEMLFNQICSKYFK